jgi:hypothetical protein
MSSHVGRRIIASVILGVAIMMLTPQIPQVRGFSGLSVDGTGTACDATIGGAVNLQSEACPEAGPSVQLCATHPGGFCPISEGPFLVILQFLLNNTETISAVISNQGLQTWTKRGSSVLNGLGGEMEEWYSIDKTDPLSNPSIGVGLSGSAAITIAAQEFAITGYDQNTPFDPNVAAPSSSTGSSNTMSTAISTNDAQDMLLGFSFGGTDGTITAGVGFTGICVNTYPCAGTTVFKGVNATASEYKVVTDTQANTSVSFTQTGATNWALIADAVQSASPSVGSIAPSKGAVGTAITITGSSFTGTTIVLFCGTSASSFTVVNDTSITTSAPQVPSPPILQTCDIMVTNGALSSSISAADKFSFLPSVASISPTVGGNATELTIVGSGFIGTVSVTVCDVQSTFRIDNDTQMTATIPDRVVTTSAPCDVVVSNPIGKSVLNSRDVFTYAPQSRNGGNCTNGGQSCPPTNQTPSARSKTDPIIYVVTAGIAFIATSSLAYGWRSRRNR